MTLRPSRWIEKGALIILTAAAFGFALFSHVAAGPTCARFNDPGAVFCDDFENNNFDGWGVGSYGSITVQPPGLGDTNHAVRFFGSGGVVASTGMDVFTPDGSTIWIEWQMLWEPGFAWAFGSDIANGWPGNSSYKTFEIRASSGSSGCQNRLLLTVWGRGENGYSSGYPFWSIYPNLTCPGGNPGVQSETYANVDGGFSFQPGRPYRLLAEVTSATGTNGRVRFWVDGNLLFDLRNIQTCGEPGGCRWDDIGLGGPQANAPASGQAWWYDQIRITRTALAPGAPPPPPPSTVDVAVPAPPTNLRVVQ